MEKMVYLITFFNRPVCWAYSHEMDYERLQHSGYSFMWVPLSLCINNQYSHLGDYILAF